MDLKEPMIIRKQGDVDKRQMYLSREVGTLAANPTSDNIPLLVSMPTKSTNMPAKSTERIMETKSLQKGISEPSQQKLFQTTTCSQRDSLVNLFQLLGKEKDSKIQEELCSSRYAELRKRSSLLFFYLKTSRGYSITKAGRLSGLSSIRFQNWGMTVNGKCITAKISEYRKTGKEYSLSDIVEEQVEGKYFLSKKMTEYLMKRIRQTKDRHKPDIVEL